MQQVSIQIKLPTTSRIHKICLKARSDNERIVSWSMQANNDDGVAHTIYNPKTFILIKQKIGIYVLL